jgi:heme A synthase
VTTHVGLMVVFAVFVSVVFATLMRDEPAEQLRLGARLLAGFVGAAIVLGWLIYPLPL